MGDNAELESIGHELKVNPPKVWTRTRAMKGPAAANKQRVAILLSKYRKSGGKTGGKKWS